MSANGKGAWTQRIGFNRIGGRDSRVEGGKEGLKRTYQLIEWSVAIDDSSSRQRTGKRLGGRGEEQSFNEVGIREREEEAPVCQHIIDLMYR